MNPLDALIAALNPIPRNVLVSSFKSLLLMGQKAGMNQTQLARYLGTNRRTLQRAIASNFESIQQRTLVNALARSQQNFLLNPQKVGQNYIAFMTGIGSPEFVRQSRQTAEAFGKVVSARVTVYTEEEGYTGYKSYRAGNYAQFDTFLSTLPSQGFSTEDIRDITYRYGN